jgi:hypothetical protein
MYLVISFGPTPGRIDVVEHGNATLQLKVGEGSNCEFLPASPPSALCKAGCMIGAVKPKMAPRQREELQPRRPTADTHSSINVYLVEGSKRIWLNCSGELTA